MFGVDRPTRKKIFMRKKGNRQHELLFLPKFVFTVTDHVSLLPYYHLPTMRN